MNVFLDTNILIYAYDNSDRPRHTIAVDLLSSLIPKSRIVISTQVINEFIVVITKKVKYPITISEAEMILKRFRENFEIRVTGMPDIKKALLICKKHKLSYWDALILASAITAKCSTIYSEDLQDGQMIETRLSIVNPFNS